MRDPTQTEQPAHHGAMRRSVPRPPCTPIAGVRSAQSSCTLSYWNTQCSFRLPAQGPWGLWGGAQTSLGGILARC